jgi:hypothetical protein
VKCAYLLRPLWSLWLDRNMIDRLLERRTSGNIVRAEGEAVN